jgi:hypothetical protein
MIERIASLTICAEEEVEAEGRCGKEQAVRTVSDILLASCYSGHVVSRLMLWINVAVDRRYRAMHLACYGTSLKFRRGGYQRKLDYPGRRRLGVTREQRKVEYEGVNC